MGRRTAREVAMKLLYQLEIQQDDRHDQIEARIAEEKLPAADTGYIRQVVDGIFDKMNLIDSYINKFSKGWKINRISKVDLSILRLSMFEIMYMDDIPYTVSVNEAVELAKKFSGEEAGSFINGILSRISKNPPNH